MRHLNSQITAATVCVAVVASLGVVSCEKPKPAVMPLGTTADRPECPHEWSERITGTDSFALTPSGKLSVPGWTTNVPEFHDCQRFRVKNGAGTGFQYDSLQAIFVRQDLDGVYHAAAGSNPARSKAAAPRARGTADVAGRKVGMGGSGTVAAAARLGSRDFGILVGVVMSEGDYKPLGLLRGFNCIFLRQTVAGYDATLVWIGYADTLCFNPPVPLKHPPEALRVSVRTVAQMGVVITDVPAVARWDWDSVAAEHYIGMKCPTGWCELTKRAVHTSSVAYSAATGAPGPAKRVRQVKGWYDEQSVANFGAVGKPVADGPKATAFPHPELAFYTLTSFAPGRWLPTATIAMPNVSPTYATKYKYVNTSNPELASGHLMTVEMCTDSLPMSGAIAPGDPCGARALLPTCKNAWFARVSFNGTVLNHFCVKYRGFPTGFDIPAVVRWRWRATDETLWIRCPTGCCEMDSEK